MKNLQQAKYKDDNGREVDASVVQVLAPYTHIADGFYNWSCGSCGNDHASRSCGWPIMGQVLGCDSCHKLNLLVPTDCDDIMGMRKLQWNSQERDEECKRLQGIEKYNEDKLLEIKRSILATIQQAIHTVAV
jgi:hypothetical protein